MAFLFISYCRESRPKAESLALDLRALHEVWLDMSLIGGQAWWDDIIKQIVKCDAFVFVLDPESLASTACQTEYEYADRLGKAILPVSIARGVDPALWPKPLAKIQFVDYSRDDKDAYKKLIEAINNLPPASPLPNPLPQAPPAPASRLGTLADKIKDPTELSLEGQSALWMELNTAHREPDDVDTVRLLITRFRARGDLRAVVAAEIDRFVANLDKPPTFFQKLSKICSFKQVWISVIGGLLISGVLERVLTPPEELLVTSSARVITKASWSLPAALLLCITIIWNKMAFRPWHIRLTLIALPLILGFAIPFRRLAILSSPAQWDWKLGFADAVLSLIFVIGVFWNETAEKPLPLKSALISLAGGMAGLVVFGFYIGTYSLVVAILVALFAAAFVVYLLFVLANKVIRWRAAP